MTPAARIVAVIPAYQAAPSIADVVAGTLQQLPEVLVVDDGSTDETGRRAREAGAEVVRHERNLGKGRALRTAFELAFGRGASAIVTLDADGQHLPQEIPHLLAACGAADLIIGSRHALFAEFGHVRRASNRVSSLMISAVAGRPLVDIQSGFRLYTRELIAATGFPERRFEAESAVVVRAARIGFRIVSVPVRLGFADGRLTSHYRPLVDSLRIAGAVTRARMEMVGWSGERYS